MLMKVYEYVVNNREEILKGINPHLNESVVRKAAKMWNSYVPTPKNSKLVGIDSSWNFKPYQGFYLFAVEAVSTFIDGSFAVEPLFDVGLGALTIEEDGKLIHDPHVELESRGMEFEYKLAMQSIEKADFVLIDGSILARFYDRRKKKPVMFYEYAKELMKQKNLAFISKVSSSNLMLGGILGDMFYFNHTNHSTGYSKPYYDEIGVTIFYARLKEFAPCIRVEVPGRLDRKMVEEYIDLFTSSSVSGYPYVLKLAHEQSKVTNQDLERLANIFGLSIEIGGREVLGE